MLLALSCALVANLSYGFGTILQAAGARRASTSGHLDVMLFARLSRQLPYLAGLGLDAIGFASSVIALRTLPLFVVQAAIAGSIGVTALTAALVFGFRLRASDTLAIAVLIVGLGLLGASARGEDPAHLSHLGGWLLLLGVVAVAGGGAVAARLPDPRGGVGLAVFAGLGFTGTAVATRALQIPAPAWHLAFEPVAIALVLYGACGMLMFASALQRGSVTAAAAVMFAVETIVPSIVGLAALGDRTRPHFQIVAALGFGLTIGSSLALARYTETVKIGERGRRSQGARGGI
jgi:drug/metabolite transporter (DMT)-like permease